MRIWLAITTVLLTLGAVCQPALAADDTPPGCPLSEPDYKGNSPRVQHGSVKYRGHAHDYAVLLPSDYGTSRRSYPVMYWLHGAGGGENHLFNTDTPNFIEDFTRDEPVIVVMVDGGVAGLYADWPGDDRKQYETVHTGTLVRHIDASYRTVADRRHRAVVGNSMGGFGAMNYAARHPGLFGVVGSFSGLLDTSPGASPGSSSFATTFSATFPAACMGGMPFGPFGDPATNQERWREYNPTANVERLRDTVVYAAVGNGAPCDAADGADNADDPDPTWTIESSLYDSNVSFHRAMRAAGLPMTFDDYGCGVHSWRYWHRDFEVFWPLMRAAFARADRAAPPAARPGRIRLSVRPGRTRVGRRTRFRFRALVRRQGRYVALRGATIRIRGGRRRTDRRGHASIVVRFKRAGRHLVTVKKRDLTMGRATVRVRR